MIPKIGISEVHLKSSIDLLSVVLSDEMILYIKYRKFHWNVSGESFMELHKLFEDHYNQLEKVIDEVAERISKLGGRTIGTAAEFAQHSRLQESPGKFPHHKEMISELLADNEMLITEIRKDIDICADDNHDAGTADLLTRILQQHETMAWILRRYLS